MKNRLRVLLLVHLLALAVITPNYGHAQDVGEISDLPFYDFGEDRADLPGNGDGRRVTCGWHGDCGNASTAGTGVDFRAQPAGQVPVAAAGNGQISFSGQSLGGYSGYGLRIDIDHGATTSRYAHLDQLLFPRNTHVCRYVTIGIAGNTSSVRGMTPHLHFEGVGAQFTPIFGERPNDTIGSAPFDKPDRTLSAGEMRNQQWVAHHGCSNGARGCADDTSAYTVDDLSRLSRCPSCPGDEFVESAQSATPTTNRWLWQWPGGYGYTDVDHGSYRYTRMQRVRDPLEPIQQVVWAPLLNATDDHWKIYAYIPRHRGRSHPSIVTPVVYYHIEWFDQSGTRIGESVRNVDQTEVQSEWVPLNSVDVPTTWIPDPSSDNRPIKVTLDNSNHGQCSGGACANRMVLADALVFIPSNCSD